MHAEIIALSLTLHSFQYFWFFVIHFQIDVLNTVSQFLLQLENCLPFGFMRINFKNVLDKFPVVFKLFLTIFHINNRGVYEIAMKDDLSLLVLLLRFFYRIKFLENSASIFETRDVAYCDLIVTLSSHLELFSLTLLLHLFPFDFDDVFDMHQAISRFYIGLLRML